MAQELGEFIEILPPMQRVSANWYMGTADAVYQNIYSIGAEQPKHVLILSGDHIYKMNYGLMLEHHNDSGADVTLATLPIRPDEVSRFGVVEVSRTGEVIGFQEKPKTTTLRSPFNPSMVDASMGIYLFNTDVLLPALMKDAEDPNSKHDFGHNILPGILGRYKISAYNFVDENKQNALYWRDVGTLEAYFDANMDVASVSLFSTCMTKRGPCAPGSGNIRRPRFVFGEPGRTGMAINSVISAGCIVSGAVVRNSVLSQDVRVNSYAEVESSIIFTHVDIGRHCRIRRAIIDRDVHLPEGTVIGYDREEDRRNYFVTQSGLTVVTRGGLLPLRKSGVARLHAAVVVPRSRPCHRYRLQSRMAVNMKRLWGRILSGLLVVLAILYAGDWIVLRLRTGSANSHSVQVEQFLRTPLKGQKEEFD